jgi:NMD protein affecting ribosome stability and mRNA decay
MHARDCCNCGRPAEAPFALLRARLLPAEIVSEAESLGISLPSDRVYCTDCLDELREDEQAEKALEDEIRSGSRCYFCCDELAPRGGPTVRLQGVRRRLCPTCKAWVEHGA